MTDVESIESNLVSEMKQRVYYVYECSVSGIVRYVGMGKGRRVDHCVSGKSTCAELNRDYFSSIKVRNSMRVSKIYTRLTKSEARVKEAQRISEYPWEQLYNSIKLQPKAVNSTLLRGSKKFEVSIKYKNNIDDILNIVVKLSPELQDESFYCLLDALNSCNLRLYPASIAGNKILLIDRSVEEGYLGYEHFGCKNYPYCYESGCS